MTPGRHWEACEVLKWGTCKVHPQHPQHHTENTPTVHDGNNRWCKGTHCKCHPHPCHADATAQWGTVLPPHCEVIVGGTEQHQGGQGGGIEISRRHQMHACHTYKQLLIGRFTGCRGNGLDNMANMAPTTTTSMMGEGTRGHVHPMNASHAYHTTPSHLWR